MSYDEKRIRRCVHDLISFAMEMKVPEDEFLTAITDILAIKLASMPKEIRLKQLEELGRFADIYSKKVKKMDKEIREILVSMGWEEV